MKKLFGKLVPHSLTIQQKLRKQISQRNLKRFKQNQTDFVQDETWIYHHDPKLKNYSG